MNTLSSQYLESTLEISIIEWCSLQTFSAPPTPPHASINLFPRTFLFTIFRKSGPRGEAFNSSLQVLSDVHHPSVPPTWILFLFIRAFHLEVSTS
jgi:hypothetical protein